LAAVERMYWQEPSRISTPGSRTRAL
jgi:hypothetical protein